MKILKLYLISFFNGKKILHLTTKLGGLSHIWIMAHGCYILK